MSTLVTGQHLFTRDGRIVGNAIITEVTPDGHYRIETDFGRGGSLLSLKEIEAWWHTEDSEGQPRISEVNQWREDKDLCRNALKRLFVH